MNSLSKYVREFITYFVIALAITLPIKLYVAQPFVVSGESMVPSFENGEYLIVDELSYHFREPARGEVVVFSYPRDPSKFFIKRVIGRPGETVVIRDGKVYIKNGATEIMWNYPDTLTETMGGNGIYPLGAEEYFVLGDNRRMSLDSRAWGTVDEHLIRGRVFVRLYPFNRIDILPAAPKNNPANTI